MTVKIEKLIKSHTRLLSTVCMHNEIFIIYAKLYHSHWDTRLLYTPPNLLQSKLWRSGKPYPNIRVYTIH